MGIRIKRAVLSHLQRLMMHIIKWFSQPEGRSSSWVKSINDARRQIEKEREKSPSIQDGFLQNEWEATEQKARKEALAETGKKADHIPPLNWKQVFEDLYDRRKQ